MNENVQLDGLLFTSDTQVLCVMNQIMESFAIQTQVCSELDPALDAVTHRRLDAVIVDWDGVADPYPHRESYPEVIPEQQLNHRRNGQWAIGNPRIAGGRKLHDSQAHERRTCAALHEGGLWNDAAEPQTLGASFP